MKKTTDNTNLGQENPKKIYYCQHERLADVPTPHRRTENPTMASIFNNAENEKSSNDILIRASVPNNNN